MLELLDLGLLGYLQTNSRGQGQPERQSHVRAAAVCVVRLLQENGDRGHRWSERSHDGNELSLRKPRRRRLLSLYSTQLRGIHHTIQGYTEDDKNRPIIVAFVDNQIGKIKELIASIARHYEVDLVSYDGFHAHATGAQQLPAIYVSDLLLLLECFSLEQVFIQGG